MNVRVPVVVSVGIAPVTAVPPASAHRMSATSAIRAVRSKGDQMPVVRKESAMKASRKPRIGLGNIWINWAKQPLKNSPNVR